MSVSITHLSVQDGNGLAEEGRELDAWALLRNDGERPVSVDVDFLINAEARGAAATAIDPGAEQWASAPVGHFDAGDHDVSVVVAVDDGETSTQVDGSASFVVGPPSSNGEPSWESREREREIDVAAREGDRLTRRAPDEVAAHFESDWAGRAILARYLAGDGDWDIRDEQWSEYMRAHEGLRVTLDEHLRNLVASATAGGEPMSVDEHFHVGIENGESIVGYQYLHGTNDNAGDFQVQGSLQPESRPGDDGTEASGERRVQYDLEYTWNDIIDPNPEYGSDIVKSAIAEAITLGHAQAYRLSISWQGQGVVVVGPAGEVLEVATLAGGAAGGAYPLQ